MRGSTFELLLVLLFSYLFLFHGIGDYSLKEPDEGRYAEIPREMIELKEYLIPHLNYLPYLEKPPLFYWFTVLAYKIFGISEFSFRLVNTFFSTLCTLSVYLFAKRYLSIKTAIYSCLILLSSFGFFSMSRIVTLDMAFATFLNLCLFSFSAYFRERKKRFLWAFYLSLSFATLTKGFAAPVLLGLLIFLFLLLRHELRFLKEMNIFTGFLIYAIIVIPWFLYVSLKVKDFPYFFLIDQHILRYLTEKHGRSEPFYYFFLVLLSGTLPYSFFIPRGFLQKRENYELTLMRLWVLIILIFFSFSGSKLPPYILPAFPAISIILGNLISEKGTQKVFPERIGYSLFFFLTFSLPFFVNGKSLPFSAIFPYLRVVCLGLGLLLILKRDLSLRSISLLLFFFSLSALFFILSQPELDRVRTQKPLALRILSEASDGDLVVSYGVFDRTILFYIKRPILIVDYEGELAFGKIAGGKEKIIIGKEEFLELFNSERRVFLVSSLRNLESLKGELGPKLKIVDFYENRFVAKNR